MAVTPVTAVVMAVAPAVVMVAPVAAVMAPMPVTMAVMAPMAGMVAVAEMMVLPLHRLDGRLRGECCGRSRRERRGAGGIGTEQAGGHERKAGERGAGAPCHGSLGHGVTSNHRPSGPALEVTLGGAG